MKIKPSSLNRTMRLLDRNHTAFVVAVFLFCVVVTRSFTNLSLDDASLMARQLPSTTDTSISTGSLRLGELTTVRRQIASLSFDDIYGMVKPWTMVSKKRLKALEQAVVKLNQQGVRGSFVECGVWQGGSAMVLLMVNLRHEIGLSRDVFLLDTFEGMPAPTVEDGAKELEKYEEIQKDQRNALESQHLLDGKWNYGPLPVVKNNLQATAYPQDKIHIVKGKVEDTLPGPLAAQMGPIAVLHCDTDFYQSTKLELELLYDRLVPGGLLWVDDYCWFQGSRKATDEFFEKRGIQASDLGDVKGALCGMFYKPLQ